jgi:hypothetical protein
MAKEGRRFSRRLGMHEFGVFGRGVVILEVAVCDITKGSFEAVGNIERDSDSEMVWWKGRTSDVMAGRTVKLLDRKGAFLPQQSPFSGHISSSILHSPSSFTAPGTSRALPARDLVSICLFSPHLQL